MSGKNPYAVALSHQWAGYIFEKYCRQVSGGSIYLSREQLAYELGLFIRNFPSNLGRLGGKANKGTSSEARKKAGAANLAKARSVKKKKA